MAITDIFARRYAKRPLWEAFGREDLALLVQCYRLIAEQLMPPDLPDGKPNPVRAEKWKLVHDRLSMELGREFLSASHYEATVMGHTNWWPYSLEMVCKNFLQAPFESDPERFMKERLSLVELAFRFHEEELARRTQNLPGLIAESNRQAATMRLRRPNFNPPDQGPPLRDSLAAAQQTFDNAVEELNERLRQAYLPLHYHNGFIQISEDQTVKKQIEEPFWRVIADPKWQNVDTDMKEAIDRRDGGGRDPALYASKSLESTIKIISGEKGWTRGGEKGAHNYIDNLGSVKNGQFISGWERDALKHFFTFVRNPLGHGPGDEPMPELTAQQTDWAIQECMSWIKSLIKRM
jgi:hypothetical protein